jgi:orotate phosphoribosyltransferase
MSPEGLPLIGQVGLAAIRTAGWQVSSIGGLTLGADPIAYAISYASSNSDSPLRAFTVRKEAKTHGTGKLIEGPFVRGDRVAIIEDVITTGSSALQAARAVTQSGGTVSGILALVDREEGGRETIQSAGFEVISLVTREQLMRLLPI